MPVWQKAHNMAVEIFHLTVDLPRSEDYGLTSQIRRSANSVPANIAEGYGRKTNKDKAHFYIIARGSAFETQNHLVYGNEVGYFENEKTNKLLNEYSKLIHELNKLISAIASSTSTLNTK
jgi:four helix bundle protein